MARVVSLDGNTVTVETEVIVHKSINDELETTDIVIKDNTQLEPYDMGLQCIIIDNGIPEYYYTGNDDVSLTGRNPNTYTHRITLIEAYKLIERDTLASLQYTQPLDSTKYTLLDVVDRALKLVRLEETGQEGSERVYDINGIGSRDANDNYVVGNLSGLALELYERKAPEMQFNTPTLSEVFDEVFLLLNGRPKMVSYTVIGIKYYNEKNNEIDLADVEEITGNQNIDKNAQKYDIYMENAISENNLNKQARVYPSNDGWATVRSGQTELTTENFLMEVPEDIERVLKFEIRADVEINYAKDTISNSTQFSGDIEVDVTSLLFDENAYGGLLYNFTNSILVGDTWWNSGGYLNNSVYFSGNQILGWHEDLDIFSPFTSINNWHLFLATAAYIGGYLDEVVYAIQLDASGKPSFNTNVRDFMFRLTYVPKETVRVQLSKEKKSGVGTLFYNQTARVVDSELLGANAQTNLDREGEKVLRFTKTVDLAINEFQLGDYYQDYKVYKVDNNRYANYSMSTAWLSKNFAKKSERINLANEPRQTEISSQNTIRNDIYTEYIEAQFTSATGDSSITAGGISAFLKTFENTVGESTEIVVVDTGLSQDILTTITSQGIGRVMSFHFGFDSNVVAGKQLILQEGIYANKFVSYTDDGILDDIKLDFYKGFTPNPDTFAQAAIVGRLLPEYSASDVTLGTKHYDLPRFNIYKDSGEVYAFSYQNEIAPNEDEIFIGNKMATDNGLVVAATEELYLYTTSATIEREQRISNYSSQKIVTGTPANSTEVKIVTNNLSTYARIQFTTYFPSNVNWAIGNANREIYMICNKTNQDTVYFIPRNKRSD